MEKWKIVLKRLATQPPFEFFLSRVINFEVNLFIDGDKEPYASRCILRISAFCY